LNQRERERERNGGSNERLHLREAETFSCLADYRAVLDHPLKTDFYLNNI
jgi:hypothetical protein